MRIQAWHEKMNKILKRITGASAAILAAGLAATPVCAEGKIYAAVTGTNTSFTKTIKMRATAKVPNVTFHYDVQAGSPQNADAANKKLAVLAGNDGVTSTGLPKIADISFTANDTKPGDGTSITKTATVDFSEVSYKEPGVYRYVITESGTAQGLSTTEDQTKALDVYVTDADGVLKVSAYVMHNNEKANAEQLDATKKLDDKDVDFEHTLTTSDVTLSKTVTGNQGSHDEYFKFTVNIKNAVPGTQFIVNLANADKDTKTNGINTTAHTNPELLTAHEDGTLTQDFWLQHGQSIVIQGLAGETGYTVTEANGSYKTNIAVTGDTSNAAENDIAAVAANTVTDKAVTKDTAVAYTNNKQGAVPTGLIMSIGGPAAIALLGGVGLVTIKAKKKEQE